MSFRIRQRGKGRMLCAWQRASCRSHAGAQSEWQEGPVSLVPTPEEASLFIAGALVVAAAAFGIVRALAKRRAQGS